MLPPCIRSSQLLSGQAVSEVMHGSFSCDLESIDYVIEKYSDPLQPQPHNSPTSHQHYTQAPYWSITAQVGPNP